MNSEMQEIRKVFEAAIESEPEDRKAESRFCLEEEWSGLEAVCRNACVPVGRILEMYRDYVLGREAGASLPGDYARILEDADAYGQLIRLKAYAEHYSKDVRYTTDRMVWAFRYLFWEESMGVLTAIFCSGHKEAPAFIKGLFRYYLLCSIAGKDRDFVRLEGLRLIENLKSKEPTQKALLRLEFQMEDAGVQKAAAEYLTIASREKPWLPALCGILDLKEM